MPNTGRPSQDCHLCRRRRVKCDLARPGCQRCFKYGVDCPGYREQHELVFRNASPLAVKKRKKRPSAKGTEQDGTNTSSESGGGRSTIPNSQNSTGATFFVFVSNTDLSSSSSSSASRDDVASSLTSLPRPLVEHWTNHSIPILLNVYSTLSFLHNIYRINARNGPLIWAAHLFSRTYVTNIRYPVHVHKESTVETQRELGTYLGKTLSSVNAALREPGGAFRDDVLATVWILASYELLVGSLIHVEPLSPWHLHTRGLYSILQTRGVEPLYTAEGRTAFWPCYNMVQVQALVSNTECPPESDTWLGIIKNHLHDGGGYGFYVSVFITKCTHVQATILGLLRRHDFAAAEEQYESLIQQLKAAEEEVNQHATTANEYKPEWDFYMRNLYFSAIIKGYSCILFLTNFLTHYANCRLPLVKLRAQHANCIQMIRAGAQFIIDSITVALSTLIAAKDKSPRVLFDAMKMVWPLKSVYVSDSALAEQKDQAEMALVFIGKEFGVRQALHTYSDKLPLPLEARLPLEMEPGDDGTPAFSQ
ncbi:hypothetical protein EsDP_00002747 [Epichloe bromicola]|uniref:Zn(2)-C6 fungal-type domain-containing protein n=1 Tax=Epichloe bromicola TaxID=79588 RepID=A0ABQ0CLP7_9HYPO